MSYSDQVPAYPFEVHSDYRNNVFMLEQELDALWPQWDSIVPRSKGPTAKGRPFNHLAYPVLSRMKWLMKRRFLLLKGHWNWGVLVAQDGKDPRKCYAHPVPPHTDGTPSTPEPPPAVPSYFNAPVSTQEDRTHETA